jgi:hypothetical protein
MNKTFNLLNNGAPWRIKTILMYTILSIVSAQLVSASNYRTTSSGLWGTSFIRGNSPGDLVLSGDTVFVNHKISLNRAITVRGVLVVNEEGFLASTKHVKLKGKESKIVNYGKIVSSGKLHVDGDFLNYGSANLKGLNVKGRLKNSGNIETDAFVLLGGNVDGGGSIYACEFKFRKNGEKTNYSISNQVLDTSSCAEDVVISDDRNGFIDEGTVSFGERDVSISNSEYSVSTTDNNSVSIEWESASAFVKASYTIQRSHNGVEWEDLGSMEAGNTDDAKQHYSYLDAWPKNGYIYYRVLMNVSNESKVLFNSELQVSDVVMAESTDSEEEMVNRSVSINLDDLNALNNVYVVNMSGDVVYNEPINQNKPFDSSLNDSSLEQGVYIVVISTAAGKNTKRVVKR